MSVTENLILPQKFPKKKLSVIESSKDENYGLIKEIIWLYFLLLLFEGALRKWFLPGLSQGLLIVRDPIVLWIYYLCYAKGLFPLNNRYLQKCVQWVGLA